MASGATTVIYIYYDSTEDDNATYIGDTDDEVAENVWDANFVAVYHMNQDPSGGASAIKDSTSNDNEGTSAGTEGVVVCNKG